MEGWGREEERTDLDEVAGEDLGVCGGHVRGIGRLGKKTRRGVRREEGCMCVRDSTGVWGKPVVWGGERAGLCMGYTHGKSVRLWAE